MGLYCQALSIEFLGWARSEALLIGAWYAFGVGAGLSQTADVRGYPNGPRPRALYLAEVTMLMALSLTAALAAEPPAPPTSLQIWGSRPGLDSHRIVDDEGTIYTRRQALVFLENESVSAAAAETYRTQRRRGLVLSAVSLVPIVGIAFFPGATRHHAAAELALRDALDQYSLLGPALVADIETLP